MRCHHQVWKSALYVHAQRTVCTTQLSKSTSSLVSCLVSEVHVVVRVHVPLVVDAVIDLTLSLIALVVIVVFVVAIFIKFCCIGGNLFTHPVGDSELLLAVTEF